MVGISITILTTKWTALIKNVADVKVVKCKNIVSIGCCINNVFTHLLIDMRREKFKFNTNTRYKKYERNGQAASCKKLGSLLDLGNYKSTLFFYQGWHLRLLCIGAPGQNERAAAQPSFELEDLSDTTVDISKVHVSLWSKTTMQQTSSNCVTLPYNSEWFDMDIIHGGCHIVPSTCWQNTLNLSPVNKLIVRLILWMCTI